ncbi:MAG: hypothetical protein ACLQVF_36855 [Isosphaeraceae bacterium]
MNPPKTKAVIVPENENEYPAPCLRHIVRNSALLNLVIVLTSCPVLVIAGGPKAVYPTLAAMAGISVLIWTATFALFSFVSLPRLFRRPVSPVILPDPALPAEEAGVADRWLDGPV